MLASLPYTYKERGCGGGGDVLVHLMSITFVSAFFTL